VNTDLLANLVQVACATFVGMLALSSGFAVVLGARHHYVSGRRDLRLAAADLVAFVWLFTALIAAPDVVTGALWSVPGQVLLAVLTFRFNSPAAERRIAHSVREARSARALD
jgi:hypothetical protein